MKVSQLAALMLAAGFASTAFAAGQGGGQIEFYGDIIDAPCSVNPDSIDQRISMGQISNKELNGGKISQTTRRFEIKLENCSTETLKTVEVMFGGTADTKDSDLLALVGTAQGAGIRLVDSSNTLIKLGQATQPTQLVNGNNTLVFGANLKGSDAAVDVTPGDFTAITTFALEYK
ncbi:MAG: fimbrial protein [Neisseriaceae bacterium]|nr:fimbrial protein [Neisseriaceae bacterium]MBP6861756.1 fimbrial protein [Neisseriaceae bacterium]